MLSVVVDESVDKVLPQMNATLEFSLHPALVKLCLKPLLEKKPLCCLEVEQLNG